MADAFSKDDPPPPPDYAAAARAQGGANLQSTIAGVVLNRPTEVTPFGTRNWTQSGSFTIPGAEGNPEVNIPQWTSNINFTPEGRRLFDQQTRIQSSMGNIAERGLGRVQSTFGTPLDTSSLGARQTGLDMNGLPQVDRSGLPQLAAPDLSGAPGRGQVDRMGGFNGQLDLNGMQQRQTGIGVAGREAVTQALLDRQAPMRQQRAEKLHSDLINRGFSQGTEAMDREMAKLGQTENDERLAAIAAGGAEQSRLVGLESQVRAQDQGERQAMYNAGLSGYGANLSGFNADMAGQQFQSQNRRDAVAEALAGADWASRTRAQLGGEQTADRSQAFGERVAGFNAGQTSRGAGLQELMAMRQLPLQELNAFRTGAQPQAPQFQNFTPVAAPGPAPVYNAARDTFGAQMDAYNANAAESNNMLSGLFRLGVAGMPYFMGGSAGAAMNASPNFMT